MLDEKKALNPGYVYRSTIKDDMHLASRPSLRKRPPAGHGQGTVFEISAKFRRNSAKNFVFASYREKKIRYFSENFVWKFKIQKKSAKIHRNSPKFTEISERNFVSAKHRDLENEMVNPGSVPIPFPKIKNWICIIRRFLYTLRSKRSHAFTKIAIP